jgi:hypothetical protein
MAIAKRKHQASESEDKNQQISSQALKHGATVLEVVPMSSRSTRAVVHVPPSHLGVCPRYRHLDDKTED